MTVLVCFGCTAEFRHYFDLKTLDVGETAKFCEACTARLYKACDSPVRHDYGGPDLSTRPGAVARREARAALASSPDVPAFVLSTRDALLDDAALAAYEKERF